MMKKKNGYTCFISLKSEICRYHDNAFATSQALHIINRVNSSVTYQLLEQFFHHQVAGAPPNKAELIFVEP